MGWSVDFTVVQPQEHFLLGIQEGQAWGLHQVQLVEPRPLFQEAGCWVVMAEKLGVEDLVNGGAHLGSSTTSTSGSYKGSY